MIRDVGPVPWHSTAGVRSTHFHRVRPGPSTSSPKCFAHYYSSSSLRDPFLVRRECGHALALRLWAPISALSYTMISMVSYTTCHVGAAQAELWGCREPILEKWLGPGPLFPCDKISSTRGVSIPWRDSVRRRPRRFPLICSIPRPRRTVLGEPRM